MYKYSIKKFEKLNEIPEFAFLFNYIYDNYQEELFEAEENTLKKWRNDYQRQLDSIHRMLSDNITDLSYQLRIINCFKNYLSKILSEVIQFWAFYQQFLNGNNLYNKQVKMYISIVEMGIVGKVRIRKLYQDFIHI